MQKVKRKEKESPVSSIKAKNRGGWSMVRCSLRKGTVKQPFLACSKEEPKQKKKLKNPKKF
uniref:Uncharacterized protein n=1 Tax=Arundo donax TaxID=35708 RepID=A0A0A9GZ49_ARUDO